MILGLLGVCVLLWLLRAAIDPEPPPASAVSAVHAGAAESSVRPAPQPAAQPAVPELPAPPEAPQLRGQDTVDPCTAGFDPPVPPGFETVVADGITVAWAPGPPAEGPYDVALQPTAVAYLVNGLLAEAAALTATLRRDRLTVIVYPSQASFRAATHAPSWSDGIYDGGAVRIAARPTAELGVEIAGLRHELLHAQLHAAVGCMPSWLNEGLAMYFAGPAPVRPWLRMLRNPDSFDLAALEVPSFAALPDDRAERAYAESLAMVVFIVERAGEAGLQAAVQEARTAARDASPAAPDLWGRLYPGAGHRAVLDSLAHRIFGVPPGGELDAILRGAVCCHGLRAVGELGCRGAAPRPDRTRWIDQTRSPRATCDANW